MYVTLRNSVVQYRCCVCVFIASYTGSEDEDDLTSPREKEQVCQTVRDVRGDGLTLTLIYLLLSVYHFTKFRWKMILI